MQGSRVYGSRVWWAREKTQRTACARCGVMRYPRTSAKEKSLTDLCRDCYGSLTVEERKAWTKNG